MTTLLGSPPSEMRLVLDGQYEIHTESHGVLVANMPYDGPNFQVGTPAAMQNNLLDVLLFAELSKLELLGNAVQVARGELKDTRIQHYKVRKIDIHSNPAMPVMVKTPAHPVAVLPPRIGAPGGWKVECNDTGVCALHTDAIGRLLHEEPVYAYLPVRRRMPPCRHPGRYRICAAVR